MARKFREERDDYMDAEALAALGERLKDLRISANLTQGEFASKIGVTAATISTAEKGKTQPSAAIIGNICRVFGVSEPWLRFGTEPKYPADEDIELRRVLDAVANGTEEQQMALRFVAGLDDKLLHALVEYAKEFFKE